MRQAEAANRVQTDFLTHMRQDIRTPVSGIVEAAARLQQTTNLSIVRQLGAEITASGEEFLRFMDELLESAEVVSKTLPVLQQKFSLQTLIDRVVKMNRPKALMKQVLILTACSNPIPNYLIGDPVRIYRIVLELVINALKVSERSTLEIVTSARPDRDGKAVIQLSVEDMGPGVPEDQQAFLFTGLYKRPVPAYARDYQGADLARDYPGAVYAHDYQGANSSRERQGAGLGLFLIKKLVDDLQGEIYYEPGTLCKDSYGKPRGAKFVCLLPLRRALSFSAIGADETDFKARAAGIGLDKPIESFHGLQPA